MSSNSARVAAFVVTLATTALATSSPARADDPGAEEDVRKTIEALQRRDEARREADRAATTQEAARAQELARASAADERAAARADTQIRDALAADASRRARRNIGVWTSVGGGAFVLLGAGLYASALSARSDVESGAFATGEELESAHARVEGSSSAGVVLGCIGGAALAAGLFLVLTTSAPDGGILGRSRVGRVSVDLARGSIAW